MKDDPEMLAGLLDHAISVEVCTIDEARGEHRRTRLSAEQMAILANAVNAANAPSFNEAIEAAAKVAQDFPREVLAMWGRPNGPPGNGMRPATNTDIASAIRALALPAPGVTP